MELKSNPTGFFIIDDDRILVRLSSTPAWILENAEPTEITMTATINEDYPSDVTVTIPLSASGNDATFNISEIVLTIPGGMGRRTATGTITVTPIQDTKELDRLLSLRRGRLKQMTI